MEKEMMASMVVARKPTRRENYNLQSFLSLYVWITTVILRIVSENSRRGKRQTIDVDVMQKLITIETEQLS